MRLVVLAGVVVMKAKIRVDAHRERVTLASQLNFSERLSGPTALGFVKLYFVWDRSGAEVGFRRAITIDPSYAATHTQWYSVYLLAAGLKDSFRRGIEHFQRAEDIDRRIAAAYSGLADC